MAKKTVTTDTALITANNELAPAAAKELTEIIKLSKEIEDKKKKLYAALTEAMAKAGVLSLKAEGDDETIVISFIDEFDRETFDSKSFRAAYPDLYDEFVRLTHIKPSVRITVK